MNTSFRWLFTIGLALIVAAAVLLIPPLPSADAQCGADASSCKRCHQGEQAFPVNAWGQWHIDHAESDFCALCHGGDKNSDDPAVAHAGMFDPLSAQASARCTACHPADAGPKLQQYTDLLVTFDASAPPVGGTEADTAAVPAGDEGYDWRNISLAAAAGFLTMFSGVVVWNLEHLGERLPRRRKED